MPIPAISHLQFLVLQTLGSIERRGRDVRARLEAERVSQSLPAFYQMMSRLEVAGLVAGDNRPFESEGQTFQERWYKVTAKGLKIRAATLDFYADCEAAGKGAIHA